MLLRAVIQYVKSNCWKNLSHCYVNSVQYGKCKKVPKAVYYFLKDQGKVGGVKKVLWFCGSINSNDTVVRLLKLLRIPISCIRIWKGISNWIIE